MSEGTSVAPPRPWNGITAKYAGRVLNDLERVRAGAQIRQGRNDLGYSNRESFAQRCGISTRVLSDIEAGTRTNFSDRILAKIEAGLGWPAGSIEQIVADPTFTPPPAPAEVFQQPHFDRNPVPVTVADLEFAIDALNQARRAYGAKPGPVEALLAGAAARTCWPYVVRVLADNWTPGRGVNPAVLPMYKAFADLANWAAPGAADGRYAAWLANGGRGTPDENRRFMERWSESRRTPSRRRP